MNRRLSSPEDFRINFDVTNAGLRSFNKYIQQSTLLKDVSELNIPVLIICGEKDTRPLWPSVQLSKLLPYCEVEILQDCNHFPWAKDSALLQKVILQWVNGCKK